MTIMMKHTSIYASAAGAICRRVLGPSATKSYGSTSEGAWRFYYASRCPPNYHRRPINFRMMASSTTQNKSVCPSSGTPLLTPAGQLFESDCIMSPIAFSDDDTNEDELDICLKDDDNLTEHVKPLESDFFFIPQVKLHDGDGSQRKRVLVLCTGGTLTMSPNPDKGGALSPVPGALTDFMKSMLELTNDKMPDVVVHEYSPLLDSSDMGPPDWIVLAKDIKANYLYFDGFVVLMGTDTMAYTATALSFMLENLGKPVVFTGSQVPIAEPHSDARQNLIMALIFAAQEMPICEVTIFFHDRLVRACRAQKVDAGQLHAFDSPNMPPLATTGIAIKENEHLALPPARGVLRVHTRMDTRLLALRLVPGFDDNILMHTITAGAESGSLRALVLQLYGTGNAPQVKEDFINCLKKATELGILVVASTQCHKGSVMMGHYATGKALESAGVVSSNDMTLEAISCKIAYLLGRGDLSNDEIANLMCVSMRGEVTHTDALPPPPFSSAFERASRKGRYYY
eukprot:CAMPEP_0172305202 /NCGR_PEP_ID=MMETSP1058-20130122/6536_1 /TAXON_ID=83371 /ORGANISM="Detonula confervacea, Strain CCMP 353" /LENGTH=513 /DNA_ID=CAMNT_0013016729 /DNA_START=8 /DNA_END=1549 /DNA_ORIENTATION=+